jgi:hypothetical protein
MKDLIRQSIITFSIILLLALTAFTQSPTPAESDIARVTVKMNADGSRSVYKFNDTRHKCTATTTEQDGTVREKIQYELDEAGRFSTGQIFGPDGRLRFKSRYKYDSAGRIEEEVQMNEKDVILHKIVYSYDPNGKQIGYSILDGSGKLVGRTTAAVANPAEASKSRKKK